MRGVQKHKRELPRRPGDRVKSTLKNGSPGLRPGPRFPSFSLLLHSFSPLRLLSTASTRTHRPHDRLRIAYHRDFFVFCHNLFFSGNLFFSYRPTQHRGHPPGLRQRVVSDLFDLSSGVSKKRTNQNHDHSLWFPDLFFF